MKTRAGLAIAALLALLVSVSARAEDPPETTAPPPDQPDATAQPPTKSRQESLTAINKALTDPVSEAWSIGLLSSSFRISPGGDRQDRWSSDLLLVGGFPVSVTPNWNFITRPSIFLFHSQLHPQPSDPTHLERTTAFGDIVLLQLIAPSKQLVGNWLIGIGPTWILPTGVSAWTTSGKWQVGPAGLLGYLSEKWILGALVQNWRSFGGSGPFKTNSLNLQPIAAYFLGSGWSIGYSGNILANFEVSRSENVWTVPVGVQISKVVLLGPVPVKIALSGQWMPVRQTTLGQVWNVGLLVQALRPKLLRGYLSEPSSLRLRWEE